MGGRLTIEARAREDAPGRPATALLRVTDTGEGMTPEVIAHIFEPFFTTKPEGEGAGLGLATVYGIVVQSGGAIEVDSVPGSGTTFEVSLPPAPPAEIPLADDAAAPAPSGRETILVVEDQAVLRGVAARRPR